MPSPELIYRFYKVPSNTIHLLKAVFESYEGMCILSTVDRAQSIVQLLIAADFIEEIEEVVAEVNPSIPLLRVYDDIQHSLGRF